MEASAGPAVPALVVLDHLSAQPAKAGDLGFELRQAVGHDRILDRAALQQPSEARIAETFGELQHRHAALGAQRRLRDLPSRVLGADEVGGRDPDVVEEHLAEVRIPDRVADRPHVDSGCGHVHQEVRNALALGSVGIGAGQQQAPVGMHTAAGPQLLAVDDVVVALASRRWCAGWPDRIRPPARRSPAPRSRRRGSREGGGGAVLRCPRPAGSTRRGGCRRTRAPAEAHRGRPTPGRAPPVRRPTVRRPTHAASAGTA